MFKFRGKRVIDNEIVCGFHCERGGKDFILVEQKDSAVLWFEIDPSTLGVSWGMKDKDVDVFTGDTLEDCCGYKGVVVFSIERSEFCLQVGDNLHPIIQGDYYKLIGNIHDNPEIIEEE